MFFSFLLIIVGTKSKTIIIRKNHQEKANRRVDDAAIAHVRLSMNSEEAEGRSLLLRAELTVRVGMFVCSFLKGSSANPSAHTHAWKHPLNSTMMGINRQHTNKTPFHCFCCLVHFSYVLHWSLGWTAVTLRLITLSSLHCCYRYQRNKYCGTKQGATKLTFPILRPHSVNGVCEFRAKYS